MCMVYSVVNVRLLQRILFALWLVVGGMIRVFVRFVWLLRISSLFYLIFEEEGEYG